MTNEPTTGKPPLIHPRYYSFLADREEDSFERNGKYVEMEWRVPVHQSALVLVDVWGWHYLKDTMERVEQITRERIAPLVTACRRAGVRVIHAPALRIARTSPYWVGKAAHGAPDSLFPVPRQEWPPKAFLERSGEYAAFARKKTPFSKQLAEDSATKCDFHPLVLPEEGDAVVGTGVELRSLLENEQRLFLFYAGFHNNACFLARDYGLIAMQAAGYQPILLRDCTTAMESAESQAASLQHEGANQLIEMFFGVSIDSSEWIAELSKPASQSI